MTKLKFNTVAICTPGQIETTNQMTAGKNKRQMIIQELTEKAKKYCAFSERCSFDLDQKLSRLGANAAARQKIVKQLKKEKYVDDERFAKIFAKSKLKNNNWGKIKIRAELHKRQIDQCIIDKAVEEIDENTYLDILKALYQKKHKELIKSNKDQIKDKTVAYCLQKGFETDLVFSVNSSLIINY